MSTAAHLSATEPTRRRPHIVAWTVGAVVMTGLLGVGAALAVTTVTSRPWIPLLAGLLTAAAVCGVGTWLVRRIDPRASRIVAVVVVLAIAGLTLLLAVPYPDRGVPASAVPGQRFWSLPSGSQLRYVKIPARGQPQPTPIIFVHGGPGTPDLAGDAGYFGQLAADGYDVYVYDEVGAGWSSRLADVEQYSRDRDVGDLESIRQLIGAPQVILVGHSYGTGVVAGYLAAHPGHVARAVVISPGPLDPDDHSPGGVRGRLPAARQARLYARILQPRNLFVYTLLQVNPRAAHTVAGDVEMDAQNDDVYAISEPALHCAGHAKAVPPTGMGFYRLQYPQSAAAPPAGDLRPLITGDPTPTLIIKGSCDYLSWASALDWRNTFAQSQIVYLAGGHNVYQDAPAEVLQSVRAFLAGRPLPIAPYTATVPPKDYQGPP